MIAMKTRVVLPALIAAGLATPPLAPAALSMELVRPLEEPGQSSTPKKITKKIQRVEKEGVQREQVGAGSDFRRQEVKRS